MSELFLRCSVYGWLCHQDRPLTRGPFYILSTVYILSLSPRPCRDYKASVRFSCQLLGLTIQRIYTWEVKLGNCIFPILALLKWGIEVYTRGIPFIDSLPYLNGDRREVGGLNSTSLDWQRDHSYNEAWCLSWMTIVTRPTHDYCQCFLTCHSSYWGLSSKSASLSVLLYFFYIWAGHFLYKFANIYWEVVCLA